MWQALQVPSVVCAMRGAALRADHVVAAVERPAAESWSPRRARPTCHATFFWTSPSFELMSPSRAPRSSTSFSVLGLGRLDLLASAVDTGRQLADLLFAVANELAQLLELTLSGVGLALRPRARQLLARVVELLVHVADVLDELAPRLVHRRGVGAIGRELFVELCDARLQPVEGGALLRQLLLEFFQFCVDLRKSLKRANLVRDAQCVTPGGGRR